MSLPAIPKLNQFIIQHIAESFNKLGLVVETFSQLQSQLHTTDVVTNTEWLSTQLGLTKGQQEATADFIRRVYTAFHNDTFCRDFVEHWIAAGLKIEPHIHDEVSNTYQQLTEHDSEMSPIQRIREYMSENSGIRELLGKMFGSTSFMSESTNTDVTDPMISELMYLQTNDDVTGHQFNKLEEALSEGKLKKYAKLMDKYGHRMQNYVRLGKKVAVLGKLTTVEPTSSETKNKWEELLTYKVNATDSMNEMQMLDLHYLQNGVVYEPPLCFDKVMSKLLYQRANDLITSEELKAQLNKILNKVLGEELASMVFLDDTEEGFAMGIKGNGFGAMMAKHEIAMRLKTIRILN